VDFGDGKSGWDSSRFLYVLTFRIAISMEISGRLVVHNLGDKPHSWRYNRDEWGTRLVGGGDLFWGRFFGCSPFVLLLGVEWLAE
jgi:hypothetical protein